MLNCRQCNFLVHRLDKGITKSTQFWVFQELQPLLELAVQSQHSKFKTLRYEPLPYTSENTLTESQNSDDQAHHEDLVSHIFRECSNSEEHLVYIVYQLEDMFEHYARMHVYPTVQYIDSCNLNDQVVPT